MILQIHISTFIMSLLGKKITVILALSIILFSCEDPSEISLDLNSNSDRLRTDYVEIPVVSSLIRADSLITQTADLMAGRYRDPIFGTTSAKAFTEVRPNITIITIGENAMFDSLILYLEINSIHGKSVSGKVQIAQLNDPMGENRLFYNFETALDKTDPRNGETSIGETIISPDFKVGNEITVELKNFLGQVMFDSLQVGSLIYSTQENFNNYFKGISIDILETESAIYSFDPNDEDTRIVMYWHEMVQPDTIFGELEFKFNQVINFNNLVNDFTGTIFENLPTFEEFNPDNGFAYFNGSAGLFTKLDISAINGFFDTLDRVTNPLVINRADLVIEGIETGEQFVFPPETFHYFFASENNRIVADTNAAVVPPLPRDLKDDIDFLLVNPEGTGARQLTATYDSASNSYKAPISFYTQALFEGVTTVPNIILHSHNVIWDSGNNNFKYNLVSLNQFVVKEENIKLKIYYSTTIRD